ncbi:MAG: alpha/beta hydrolase family protein, partial [Acidobacteriota bacterium]
PEYGESVDLKTDNVDASPFLKGWKGFKAKARKWYWKFEPKNFPLNGRVWYPAGDGPFALVLVVHGNHKMEEFSDPGYAYLGELLASRGFITVSVDENFLNSSWAGGLKKENSARGWILLQHLKVWQSWNEKEANPFYRKVDMDHIALIGHSRGGEAVAIAASFNRLSHYPDDATILFDFNFSIKSIIAIAPSDGQFKPASKPVSLQNINYLVLQGAHDSDVSIFLGIRQYQRVKFTDEHYWFKSALYIYQANHGQFNTVWGRTDFYGPANWLLNLKPLLKGEDQRQIAKVYMSSFLEATLHEKQEYIPLFRDHRVIAEWLPKTIYISQFEDSRQRMVSDYEEDVDVTTTTVAGGVQQGENLAVWREQGLNFRGDSAQNNNAVYLGWNTEDKGEQSENKIARYSITLPDGLAQEWQLNPDALLICTLADADESPPKPGEENEKEESEKNNKAEDEKEALDLTIELITKDGSTASLPLSQFSLIPPALTVQFTKWHYMEKKQYKNPTEAVLQTYELPLSAFVEANSQFRPTDLKTIRFIFDRTPKGVIILDEVGFRTVK